MYERKLTRTIEVSPRKAEEFLHLNTFPGQRPMSPRKVNTYASLLKEGRFRVAEVALAKTPDGRQYLMNGQQTCQASMMSQIGFTACYQEYDCLTDRDLYALFGSFDVHGVRSEIDLIRGVRGLFKHKELNELGLQVLQLCSSALFYLGDGISPNFSNKANTKIAKAMLVDQDNVKDEVLMVNEYVQLGGARPKVAVVVAMLATFRKNPVKARLFWDRVIGGDKLERGSPQYNLHNFLASSSPTAGTGGLHGHTTRYKTCIAWWNSFVEGTSRMTVKVEAMKTLPEVKG